VTPGKAQRKPTESRHKGEKPHQRFSAEHIEDGCKRLKSEDNEHWRNARNSLEVKVEADVCDQSLGNEVSSCGEESDISVHFEAENGSKKRKPASKRKRITSTKHNKVNRFLGKAKKGTFVCRKNHCRKVFTCKEDLEEHRLCHIGEKPFECEICQKCFEKPSYLEQHMVFHKDQRDFACDQCSKQFHMPSALKKHKRMHQTEKEQHTTELKKLKPETERFERGVVGNETSSSFRKNENNFPSNSSRFSQKKYKCLKVHCEKRFATKAELRLHRLTHIGEMPFKCEVCSKCFKFASGLKQHMLFHNDQRDFACDKCPVRCHTLHILRDHQEVHHSDERRMVKCDVCSATFKDRAGLWRHSFKHRLFIFLFPFFLFALSCGNEHVTPLD
jgi:KRAB domain-containing zinc finger protein